MPGQQDLYKGLAGYTQEKVPTGKQVWKAGTTTTKTYAPFPALPWFKVTVPSTTEGQMVDETVPRWQQALNEIEKPYEGKLAAGLSEAEQMGIDMVKNYQPGELYNASKQTLLDTLSGKYDPTTAGGYWDAYKAVMGENLDEAITATRQSAALGGMMTSSPRINAESDLRRKALNDMGVTLGELYNNERARQMEAATLGSTMEQNQLKEQAELLLEAGKTEREVEQLLLDKEYQERVRQLEAIGLTYELAVKLATLSPANSTTQTQETNGNILGTLASIASIPLTGGASGVSLLGSVL